MSEAVTVPGLMLITSSVSKESLARDRQTDTHTHGQTDRHSLVYINLFKVLRDYENKNETKKT